MRRVAALLRRHAFGIDAVVAVLLAAFVTEDILLSDLTGDPAILVPAGLAMTLPLAWRRRRPLAVLCVGMGALAIASVLIPGSTGAEPDTVMIPLLLATYSVGVYSELRRAQIGLAVTLAALTLNEPGDLIVLAPLFTGVWAAGLVVRARERDARRLRELAEALERERVEEARLAVVEERARIARDLHDVVAHAMTTIVLQAGAERLSLGDQRGSTRDTLQSIERTGRQALVEMRRLLGVLRRDDDEPELAPTPGLAHLDELLERVTRAGLAVEKRISGTPRELQPSLDITAYRIVQEALTNVLKHAGAGSASVDVTYGERTLELEVADDGRGGSPNGRAGGHGLQGLRERVALFGGHLDAGRRDGGGFAVKARLPLGPRER
jgi:signal transduction histidine kinase